MNDDIIEEAKVDIAPLQQLETIHEHEEDEEVV